MTKEINRDDFTKNETAFLNENYVPFSPVWEVCNKEQTEKYFDSVKVFVTAYAGCDEAAPIKDCFNIFGSEPVNMVLHREKIRVQNADTHSKPYIINGLRGKYLTLRGFLYAAGIANDRIIYNDDNGYYDALMADYEDFCTADEMRVKAIEDKRKAAAEKRKATLANKKSV